MLFFGAKKETTTLESHRQTTILSGVFANKLNGFLRKFSKQIFHSIFYLFNSWAEQKTTPKILKVKIIIKKKKSTNLTLSRAQADKHTIHTKTHTKRHVHCATIHLNDWSVSLIWRFNKHLSASLCVHNSFFFFSFFILFFFFLFLFCYPFLHNRFYYYYSVSVALLLRFIGFGWNVWFWLVPCMGVCVCEYMCVCC